MTNDRLPQELTQESLVRSFTHISIPSEIWLRKDISIQAKALWAELRSLHNKEKGGCFASDDYLSEFMGLKRSRLHELFKELKDVGLMEVVSFNGRQTVRKAIVPAVEYLQSGQQLSGKPDTSYPENRTSAVRKTGFTPYIYNKEENKEEKHLQPLVGSSAPFSRKKAKEEKIEVYPRVWLTVTQKESLLQKLEGNEALLKKCYEILSDWKIGKGITGGPNDYSTFTKWVIDAAKDQSLTSKTTKDYSEEDKKLATKIWEKFKGRTDIHMGFKYIEFDNGQTVAHIEFGSKDFRGQCLEQLKKRKLNIEGL